MGQEAEGTGSQELQTAGKYFNVNILTHQLKLCRRGWEGGSVNRMLATQVQGPKFNPHNNTKSNQANKQTNKSGVSYA